ncbi:metal ABC transporter solute-binding protein, Zn/Mn family [Lusitaniella coriacea]|uniref:metal ABC transporter solute-binding protein, Zn/Mn family n=1 Tax=Lusitaniella coriacea TaxID=1983105 RepID=UPI003CF897E1
MVQKYRRLGRLTVGAISAIAIGLGSCQTNAPTTNSDSQEQSTTAATTDELQVVTTFLPITQFTKAVAGDRAEVNQLLPANVSPHDYQAKPKDAQRLAEADVLVQNGLEMEEFLEDLVTNASNPDLKIVDSSEGIATIANEEVEGGSHGEGEDHDRDHDHDHAHDDREESEEKAEAGHHHHGEYNPHVWLDPKRAIEQVENIRDGLIAADPEGEAEYTANAAAYIEQLQQLDAEITSTLQPYAGQTFVAFHDFAPYFAQSYDLEAQFLVDIPEENPAPADVKRVADAVEEANLKALLTEPQAGENTFAALAKDLNVEIGTFDPIETGSPEALEPEYYITTMRQNVQGLVTAFGGSTQSVLPFWMPQPMAVVPQRVGVRF